MVSIRRLVRSFRFASLSSGPGLRRRNQERTRRTSLSTESVEQRCLLSAVDGIVANFGGGPGTGRGQGAMNPLTSIPRLNSNPGAPVTVYLDFDGHTESNDWPAQRTDGMTGPIVTPVFDVDNDFTTFSDEELRMIEEMWYRVSEDFMPFNVNVTTVDPGSFNDFEAVLVSIGGNGSWIGSPGGIAFLNSFNGGAVNTSYVFTDNTGRGGIDHMKGSALAASHEVGHMLGLNHNAEYDANGNPIMGAPYGSFRETWSNNPGNTSVTILQDDLAIITGSRNQVIRFRNDDHGNTIQTATVLDASAPAVGDTGILEQNDDIDFFRFQTDTGNISFSVLGLNLATVQGVAGLNPGTNADLVLRLYDAAGVEIAVDNPASSLNASLAATVNAGTYYVSVSGTGQYGAIGQYTLSGTVVPLPSIPTMLLPVGVLSQPVPTFEWTSGANSASYDLEVDNLTANRLGYYTANVTTTSHTANRQFEQGDYRARVRNRASNGTITDWSNYVQFTVDIPNPATPVIRRPQGDVGDSFPTYQWDPAANAASYSLWVTSLTSGQRVLYRTGEVGTQYTHFEALPDGPYRAWVRAFNAIGEFSPWSMPVDFRIDAPVPATPQLTAPVSPAASLNPRFVWTAVDGVSYYDLWVNNLTTGTAQYIRQTNLSRLRNYYDPTQMTQGNYTAWIRAINGSGEASPWSNPYNFTVDIPAPAVPKMTGPTGPNGSLTINTINPTFTWTAAARAVKYDLWVNNVTTGQIQIIRKTDLTTTTYTSLNNLPQGEYRAFVRGINSAGEVGDWSPAYVFTIDEPAPLVPVITEPLANAGGAVESANPTFKWTIAANAPFYEFKLDDQTLNQIDVVRVSGLTDKQYTIPTAKRLAERIYVARVRAYNNSGDVSNWSEPFRIRVDVPNPSTPTLLGPGDTIRDTTPEFSWTYSRTAFRYEILVRDLLRNENIVLNVSAFSVNPEGTIASYVLPNDKALRPGTYRFWIRAFNSLGQASNWSTSKTFVIAEASSPEGEAGNTLLASAAARPVLTALVSPVSDNTPGRSVEVPPVDPAPEMSETPAPVVAEEGTPRIRPVGPVELIDAVVWQIADPSITA
jgi:hypothetical protein